MTHAPRAAFLGGSLCAVFAFAVAAEPKSVALIGKASIPWNAVDKSDLTRLVESGVPHNRLGSFGSGIDYTGKDDLYIAIDDRGPGDGASRFRARFQTFKIVIAPGKAEPVRVELVSTTLLTDERGRGLMGFAGDLDTRFDPEAVRVSNAGTLFIAEEYGPFVDEYAMDGKRLRRFATPPKFVPDRPSENALDELPPRNQKGRQPNRGFEGLALTPDGKSLYAVLQSPLIQDHALGGPDHKRVGINIRMLKLDAGTGAPSEYVYQLERASNGVNELLAIDERTFIALERDGKPGKDASSRALYRVGVSRATEVSSIDALPEKKLPDSIRAADKQLLVDFLDPALALAGETMPEKIEGLCFGPDLPDGRRTIVVTTDNDFLMDAPSWFWVFAIPPTALSAER